MRCPLRVPFCTQHIHTLCKLDDIEPASWPEIRSVQILYMNPTANTNIRLLYRTPSPSSSLKIHVNCPLNQASPDHQTANTYRERYDWEVVPVVSVVQCLIALSMLFPELSAHVLGGTGHTVQYVWSTHLLTAIAQ